MSSGTAPLTKKLVDAAYERLRIPIKQAYGLSETSPTTHSQPWHTWYKNVGSVGLLLANKTVKYMSPEGKVVPVGETGELWVKGLNIFQDYLNNVEGNWNALTEVSYFKTRDVGYQDQDGNLYITDQVKELIKYKGFQVPPEELEGYLLSHPDVEDAAVIGIFVEEQATEVPMALIVLARGIDGNAAKEKQVLDWINTRVANHKRLRGGIRWVEEVPESPSGKILRRGLKLRAQTEKFLRANL